VLVAIAASWFSGRLDRSGQLVRVVYGSMCSWALIHGRDTHLTTGDAFSRVFCEP
jgi:hypothetical protein